MTGKDELHLLHIVGNEVLDLARIAESGEVTNSDLQGLAEVAAMRIIAYVRASK